MISSTVAIRIMRTHLDSQGLTNWNPQIFTNQPRKTVGICKYGPKIIGVASHHLKTLTMHQLKHVILHEIAHALEMEWYGTSGHGQTFRDICFLIGCEFDGPIMKHLNETKKYALVAVNGKKIVFKKEVETIYDTGFPALRFLELDDWNHYNNGSIEFDKLLFVNN